MPAQWDAERVVDRTQAEGLIRSQMPDVTCRSIEPLGMGWDNTVYRVDDDWVFRFPRRQIAAELITTECAVLPELVERLPLPVSCPVHVGQPTDDYPWPFAGYGYLPGTTACRAGLDEDQRRAMAEPLAEFLAALHGIPSPELAALDLPGDVIGRMNLDKRLPQIEERFAKLKRAGVVAEPKRWAPLTRSLPRGPRPTCLVHGDFYPCQMLVDDSGRLTGIIDWGDVHLGDPACDLMIGFALLAPGARSEFRDAYGGIDGTTWILARFRALHYTLAIVEYAHGTDDAVLLREGLESLERLAPTEATHP